MKISQEASVFDNEQMSEDINDASTKAKSYMSFKSGYGLMIADLTDGEVAPDEVTTGTRNVLISPIDVKIRNGLEQLALFGTDIYLGTETHGMKLVRGSTYASGTYIELINPVGYGSTSPLYANSTFSTTGLVFKSKYESDISYKTGVRMGIGYGEYLQAGYITVCDYQGSGTIHLYGGTGDINIDGKLESSIVAANALKAVNTIESKRYYVSGRTDGDGLEVIAQIGERVKDEPSAISMPDQTYTELASIHLTAGSWVLITSVRFAANTNGIRRSLVTTEEYWDGTPTSMAIATMTNDNPAPAGQMTYSHASIVITPGSYQKYTLVGYQSSGVALSAIGRIYAVRIA